MKKPSNVRLATEKSLRLIIGVILLVLASRTFNANAQTETNLYSFVGSPNDGRYPFVGLVQGSDGNFYGMAYAASTNCSCGTVFRISPSGTYTNLSSFVVSPTDGTIPMAGLVQGSDGNFYGTAHGGGTSTNCNGGCGTVFRISPSGSYTNLYSFGGFPTDGSIPNGLVQGSDGNFYGTTIRGGTNNYGAVFRISPSGSYTNLYSFGGFPTDGSIPNGLVQGSDGNFYGTTGDGGTNFCNCGTVFRISPSGTKTNLYSFGSHLSDGVRPSTGLVQGSDGNFYGTTIRGGTNNYGTVFRISPSGSYTNLYSFVGSPPNGLVQGSDGFFYGTAFYGGTSTNCNCGTVFRISPSGDYTNLYSFGTSPTDGNNPDAALVQGSDGNFYGTAFYGGANDNGTVFKLTVPLSPLANQISAVQIAGNDIAVNIPSVAYETYQLQFTTDLTSGAWSNVLGASVTNSIGALLTLTNFGGALQPQGFYRFDITP